MSTAPTPPAAPTAPAERRVKKRIYILLLLLLLLVALAIGLSVRGTWADTEVKDPSTLETGAVTQLLKKPDGNVVVRCAILVDAAPKDVWTVITDYGQHANFLPYVSEVKAVKQPDGRWLIDAVTHSRLWGDWPFQSLVTHKETPAEAAYATAWSEENKDEFKINRGGWSLARAGKENLTLLAFTLQVELKDYPDFIVHNVIMDRLRSFVRAMRDETLRRKKAS